MGPGWGQRGVVARSRASLEAVLSGFSPSQGHARVETAGVQRADFQESGAGALEVHVVERSTCLVPVGLADVSGRDVFKTSHFVLLFCVV